jgi:predicted nucleotidyltransferase
VTHVPELDRDVSRQAVQELHRGLGESLIAVVLFGSRARQDHEVGSDWDLLVIAEELPERYFDRQLLVNGLVAECPGPISLIARTSQEFESHVASLYLDVAMDGRVLYDPTGYVSDRLAHLRRLIEEAGLSRERTAAGDVWSWRRPPRGQWVMTWERIGDWL